MRYYILIVLALLLSPIGLSHAADTKYSEDQYPEWVAEQLGLLDGTVTLGEWKKSHPDDLISLFTHAIAKANPGTYSNWCVRTETQMDLGNGNNAIRYAYFYPPKAPETFELPDEKDAASQVDKQCTLGLIWTERREDSSERGKGLARRVRTAIDRRFGKGEAGVKMQFWGAGFWTETGRWQTGEATLVSAYKDYIKYRTSESNAFAFTFLPVSGLWVDKTPPPGRYLHDEQEFPGARARRMISQSGITGYEEKQMLQIITDIEASYKEKSMEKRELLGRRTVEALQGWIATASELDAPRRAAALLAADQLLLMTSYSFGIENPGRGKQARQKLAKLGASFKYIELDRHYNYTRTWLKKAREIHPDGPAGDLAFRLLMEVGFKTSGVCSADDMRIWKVIKEGELYLQKKHDSVNTAAVELMVANAYRDIVTMADGGETQADPEKYQREAVGARQKAIHYYRKGLAKAKYTGETKFAWTEAWRMIVGLPPINVIYYCHGD